MSFFYPFRNAFRASFSTLFGAFRGQRRTLPAGDGGGRGAGKRTDSARFAPVFWAAIVHPLRTLPHFELGAVCFGKAKSLSFLHAFFMDFDLIFSAFWRLVAPGGYLCCRLGAPGTAEGSRVAF